jgi:hypothetical protein
MSIEINKPSWKLEAERVGESLPEYWSFPELARLLDLTTTTYLVRLARESRLPSYKIGTVRFVRHEQIQMVMNIMKRK